jgi:hypothetical protein
MLPEWMLVGSVIPVLRNPVDVGVAIVAKFPNVETVDAVSVADVPWVIPRLRSPRLGLPAPNQEASCC